jgi:hypothetical protein
LFVRKKKLSVKKTLIIFLGLSTYDDLIRLEETWTRIEVILVKAGELEILTEDRRNWNVIVTSLCPHGS